MRRVQVRTATVQDAEALAPQMREADALEVFRASGLEPLPAVLRSMESSFGEPGAILFDGDVAALYGITKADALGSVMVPWLLTSHHIERYKGDFLRIGKVVVNRWAEQHPVLMQMVDVEYRGAQEFLRALGFELFPPVPHGVFGAPFRPALRVSKYV